MSDNGAGVIRKFHKTTFRGFFSEREFVDFLHLIWRHFCHYITSYTFYTYRSKLTNFSPFAKQFHRLFPLNVIATYLLLLSTEWSCPVDANEQWRHKDFWFCCSWFVSRSVALCIPEKSHTAKILDRKFETYISRKGTVRLQSHFLHSCFCVRFI